MTQQRAVEVARRLVERLLTLGVREVALSPGSRSGPLALALHAADAQALLRLHVRVDERESGFLALGMAKATRRPAAVITTSGTAVANLHPALLEARHSATALIAVTADRPARLRGTGANQVTDQVQIFGGFPTLSDVDDLTGAGPEHLNLEFDEPLVEPVDWQFDAGGADLPARPEAQTTLTIDPGPCTVVVAGDEAGRAARQLAQAGRWPLLAEPSSGSRSGPALIHYRALLGDLAPEIERVISFGHPTLSRPITQLLARTDIDVVHVGTQATFPVPAGSRVQFVEAVEVSGPDAGDWFDRWQLADTRAAADLVLTEPLAVARAVARAVPPGGFLVVGPSNPIRDLDAVMEPFVVAERRFVIANRGLAGIDGMVSTAVGAALARSATRVIAYLGDLTFLHGSNGLLIGPAEPRPDLTIVVANDDGGSIFTTLEQGAPEYAVAFERVWRTPTRADLGALCAGYGIAHRRVEVADLPVALATPPQGIEVVEVPLQRFGS